MEITRRFEFDAAHRVLGHSGKCRFLHGHHYVVEISIRAFKLDSLDMVLDFSDLKSQVGGWINEHWDHNILLHSDDPLLLVKFPGEVFAERNPYVFHDKNPTAEVMAQFLHQKFEDQWKDVGASLSHVRVYETPNCWADCYGKEP